ncbi:hypothetical protein MAM1_0038d02782 [Mucor ambiguus]|uniref:Uncharacterized protein n=1 Tax=Mucor ambiguus TaxID=91626 RepID=A0A0C9M8B8_9FUNG|nr:hypothetical protein MAM1_0038d02782 [Mucor ambiguus]
MAEIIDYFYRTHGRSDYFETEESTYSKYGNFGANNGSFVVPNISISEGIEKWLALKKYVLEINNYDIEHLDAFYENRNEELN